MDETLSVDDVLVAAVTEAIAMVGTATWLGAPLVSFDARCFPDAWSPDLQGVRTAIRRFLRHAGLPELPVVVKDERAAGRPDAPVVDPVAFSGIEDGRAGFAVFAINDPDNLAAWLCLEVVRAWAEWKGITRHEPLAYRAIPTEDLPPQPEAVLDASSATVIAIGLGLGPVLAAGSVQSHKREDVQGGWVQTQWSRAVVGGFPPPVLARLLAIYAVTRDSNGAEQGVLRESLPEDVRVDFDAAIEELSDEAEALRERVGLPLQPSARRRPIEDGPLAPDPVEVDDALQRAEEAHQESQRAFNRDRRVYRIPQRHTWGGIAVGGLTGALLGGFALTGAGAVVSAFAGCIAVGGWLGYSRWFYRCSDPECAGRPTAAMSTCPGCGGAIAGELSHARERLDHDD